ncbi:MAG: hypothetical protein FWD13_02660 [Treponema sp.]|nr:hypothetical protein [Treponema sp.]
MAAILSSPKIVLCPAPNSTNNMPNQSPTPILMNQLLDKLTGTAAFELIHRTKVR